MDGDGAFDGDGDGLRVAARASDRVGEALVTELPALVVACFGDAVGA